MPLLQHNSKHSFWLQWFAVSKYWSCFYSFTSSIDVAWKNRIYQARIVFRENFKVNQAISLNSFSKKWKQSSVVTLCVKVIASNFNWIRNTNTNDVTVPNFIAGTRYRQTTSTVSSKMFFTKNNGSQHHTPYEYHWNNLIVNVKQYRSAPNKCIWFFSYTHTHAISKKTVLFFFVQFLFP